MSSPVADSKTEQATPLLEELQEAGLLVVDDWQALPPAVRSELEKQEDRGRLLARLVEEELLTPYQADTIGAGRIADLLLGNYRILDRLGSGDMAVVYRAERLKSRHEVAIKVFTAAPGPDDTQMLRFFAERKTVAQLRHPNIVNMVDVGEQPASKPGQLSIYYYVMEHVAGQDLEALVKQNGPLPPERACEVVFQAASALAEAHRHGLVHRNVEPANILITDDGKVKLLDFGLARQSSGRMTLPGTAVGALDYMAPEQATDAHSVDIRADIYGLGGTCYYMLTGQAPYAEEKTLARKILAKQERAPKAIRSLRAEVPHGLIAMVERMMAKEPGQRYQTPQELMKALEPLLPPGSESLQVAKEPSGGSAATSTPAAAPAAAVAEPTETCHVLIIDKDETVRSACRTVAETAGLVCVEAKTGKEAAEAAAVQPPDIVLLADQLADQPGLAVLRKIRQTASSPYQKVIMLAGDGQVPIKQILAAGADDYLTKPLDAEQLQARLAIFRELKRSQDRADRLARQLAAEKAAPPPAEKPQAPTKTGILGRLWPFSRRE
jgi:serine/threonine protein kinase/DNA-binding NarL/FixJ family response regulator